MARPRYYYPPEGYYSPTVTNPGQTGPIYPGGAAGVDADFALRNAFAGADLNGWLGLNNGIRGTAAGLASNAQIGRGRQSLLPAYRQLEEYSRTGGISDDEAGLLERTAVDDVSAQAAARRGQIARGFASRGLSANPGLVASANAGNDMDAAYNRTRTRAGIVAERAGNRLGAAQGFAGMSQALAGLETAPTQEGAMSMLPDAERFHQQNMGYYNDWRNATRGPNGAQLNPARPLQPNYPSPWGGPMPRRRGAGGFGGGGGGGRTRRPRPLAFGNGTSPSPTAGGGYYGTGAPVGSAVSPDQFRYYA